MRLIRADDMAFLAEGWHWLTFERTGTVAHHTHNLWPMVDELHKWCRDQFGPKHDKLNVGRWVAYHDLVGFRDTADATATLLRWG